MVTVALLDAALLVSGAVVTESVFAWPGLGTLFTEALARRDYPVLMAMLMVASGAIVAVNVAADAILCAPRSAGDDVNVLARSGSAGRAAALVLLVLLVAAAAAPVISRHQPNDLDLANRRAAPSATHWFGTDELGRDCCRACCMARASRSPSACWRD